MHPTSEAGVAEFTLKAVVVGVLLGILFGAANAYLGLRVGMTVTASIPAAVMSVVVFRALRLKSTILEANLSQTIGSASTSLATGTIFTIPALFLWGIVPPYMQVVALCFLGGLLGIAAMIPLRRLLIVDAHAELPYPEGTACAEVLRATEAGSEGRGTWIFRGMLAGAAVKLAIAAFFLLPGEVSAALPVLPKAIIALEVAPALIAVGYILGYRQSGVLVAGSILSWLALIPLLAWLGGAIPTPVFPETVLPIADMSAGQIWSRYVRYIGAGAVATAGILTVLRNLPTMVGAFTAVARGVSRQRGGQAGATPRTERDLPGAVILAGIGTVIVATAVIPGIFGGGLTPAQRLICAAGVALFGLLFVAVAARIVGIVGVSSQPTSGITLVTLLGVAGVFAWQGWTDSGSRAAVLAVGTVVAIAASKAGDISQDLKTGWLVGATPARQQLGQLIGAAFACWAVAATVLLLGRTYEFGSAELAAPQATLMKTIVEGVLAGSLPWELVGTGAGVAIGAMLCGVSGLAFAIGVYLPLASMLPIYAGGCVRAWVEHRRGKEASSEFDSGVLAASGLVAGEGLAGVAVAFLAWRGWIPKVRDPWIAGLPGETLGLLVAGAIALLLAVASRPVARRA
ncbi:MAG: oligopeptide transporter, OPT family [Thermoanaerobaculia bacterium]|nr:MAG: oligopeptide transporter, OPT family [Thermoanaerobaculia bacterium]MBZ0103364.1 oligopeptide transporter, OPT family [Thermoanaerobaculia bacterium]